MSIVKISITHSWFCIEAIFPSAQNKVLNKFFLYFYIAENIWSLLLMWLFSVFLLQKPKMQQSKQSLTGNFSILKIWENNMNLKLVSNFAHICIIYFKNVNLNSDFTKDFFFWSPLKLNRLLGKPNPNVLCLLLFEDTLYHWFCCCCWVFFRVFLCIVSNLK